MEFESSIFLHGGDYNPALLMWHVNNEYLGRGYCPAGGWCASMRPLN